LRSERGSILQASSNASMQAIGSRQKIFPQRHRISAVAPGIKHTRRRKKQVSRKCARRIARAPFNPIPVFIASRELEFFVPAVRVQTMIESKSAECRHLVILPSHCAASLQLSST